MHITGVLKQAWHTAWNYRALWVFGIILALTTTSWPAATWYGRNNENEEGRGSFVYVLPNESTIEIPGRENNLPSPPRLDEGGDVVFNHKHQADGRPYHQGDVIINYNPPDEYAIAVVAKEQGGDLYLQPLDIRPGTVQAIVGIGIGLACLILLLILTAPVARYVARTALIHMVDDHEKTGGRPTLRQGLRMGWSRSAWRLFLIDLLVTLAAVLAFTLLFALVALPVLMMIQGSTTVRAIGILVTGSLFFLVLSLAVVGGVVLSPLRRIFRRACVLGEMGVIEAIRRGYGVARRNLKDVGLTWLIALGVRLGWPVAILPLVFMLIGAGVMLAGLPALLAHGLAGLTIGGETPVFWALAVGIPLFLLVLVAPLVFLGGMREVFLSSVWTLAYRELRQEEAARKEPQQVPELDASGLEAPLAA